MRRRAARYAAVLVAATFGLAGCGYALSGRGVTVDPSIKKIGVPIFKNRSSKPDLDRLITDEVIAELAKRGHFEVVQDGAGVDALVDGEILSYVVRAVGFTAGGTTAQPSTEASRYTITITAKVHYTKVGATDPLWANDYFLASEDYDLGSDPTALFDRENQAVERLSEAFARNLVSTMLEAF
jgi:hypothetical protein